MREIKFRAWDKEFKKMEYVGELHFYHPRGTKPGLLASICIDKFDYVYPLEKFELMQYTGLKDKNGKEIYESDIGHYPYDSEYDGRIPEGKNLWEVRWEGDMYMLYRGEGDHARYTGDDNCGDDPHYNKWEEFEIKGNIYENPNLF